MLTRTELALSFLIKFNYYLFKMLPSKESAAAPLDNASPDKTEGRFVLKRNGSQQEMDKAKIRARLSELTEGLNAEYLNLDVVIEKVAAGSYPSK